MAEKNEFEELNTSVDEAVPSAITENEFSANNSSNISFGSAGQIYDWSKAPDGVKAPPRVDLNDKVITIVKADIVIPSLDKPWEKTKAGDKNFKYCTFVLHYDFQGQQEFYSGVRVFEREGKYSHPTVTHDEKNQASKLLGLYANFKNKNINEISLREFMGFLNSQPKAQIKVEEVINPTTGVKIKKNLVGKFVI